MLAGFLVDGPDYRALPLNRQTERERESSALQGDGGRRRRHVRNSFRGAGVNNGVEGKTRARHQKPPAKKHDEPRAVDCYDIERLLAVVTVRPIITPSQLRFRLLAYTGLRPGVLAQLEARNVDFRTGRLRA